MCVCEELQYGRKHSDGLRQDFIDGDFYATNPSDQKFYRYNSYVPSDVNTYHKINYVWLPTQTQTQKRIRSYVNCAFRLLQDFYYWCALQRKNHIERVKGVSMEELWLMFYMWREHYKVWDNDEWVQLKEKIIEKEKK